jgi:hypothetical protein
MNTTPLDPSERLARRVARELAGARAWVAPELEAIAAMVPSLDTPEVAVIAAAAISARGEVALARELPPAQRLVAVLSAPVRIVRRIAAPSVVVARAFSELGVIDVTAAGLVIAELAPGVSAVDVQRHAEPTLFIRPGLAAMEP